MKLNAKSLIAHKFVYPGCERPALNRLRIEPDGTTVGINGHVMCIVTPVTDDGQEPPDAVHVARNAANEMASDLKSHKHETYDWHDGEFRREHDHGRRAIAPTKEDVGQYPGWAAVVPDDNEGDNTALMDVALLGKALAAVKEFLSGSDTRGATIRISNDELGPIKITAKNPDTGQTMTVVVMPLRV